MREIATDKQKLGGMCAIASFALAVAFREYGYEADVYCGYWAYRPSGDHCWVESDRLIYDLTATQFGERQEILVCDRLDKRFGAYRELHNDYRDFAKWPKHQRPFPEDVGGIVSRLRDTEW